MVPWVGLQCIIVALSGPTHLNFKILVTCIQWHLYISPLYMGNPQTGTFINSEDPDEMPHNADISSVSTLVVKVKKIFRQKMQYIFF